MPPKKQKKPLKKQSFDVFKDLDPDCIKDEDLLLVYRIKSTPCVQFTCRRNCKGNPYCLSELGEGQWISESNEQLQDEEEPKLFCREPGTHIGLGNLGATCYVNSLLQLWFHNPRFRRAIYDWCPLEDPIEQHNRLLMKYESYEPSCEIAHLQALFALMSFSERSHIDPKDFVESLGLDTSTQQDAQEFSKLFISLLEERLKFQTNPLVRNLITENFQGEYSYRTRCSGCGKESVSPSMFYELELNIMGHKTLDGSLAEYLDEEKLEGADKYSCSTCGDKKDAVRYTKLETLPPTLNLQLMRFQYDRQKGYKKKLNSCILFPEVLDMRKYVIDPNNKDDDYDGDDEGCDENDNDEDSDGDNNGYGKNENHFEDAKGSRNIRKKMKNVEYIYHLTAVLAHRGSSANSGHYIACIKDSSGAWYTFNDQTVKAEGKKLKLYFEENDDGPKPSTSRLPRGYQSSTKAYMLVYTRMDCVTNSQELERLNNFCKLDPRLRTYVRRHNEKFKSWIEEETSLRKCCLASSNELKETMVSVIFSLPVENISNLSSFEAMPIDWISHWLKNAKNKVLPIDRQNIVCPHDRLNPDCINHIKYINKEAGDMLSEKYGDEGPRLVGDGIICKQCVINRCKVFHSKNRITEDNKEISNLLKIKMEEGEHGFWVDKESLKSWKQLAKVEVEHEVPDVNGLSPDPSSSANTLNGEELKGKKDAFKIEPSSIKTEITSDNENEEIESEISKPKENDMSKEVIPSQNIIQNNTTFIDSLTSSQEIQIPNQKTNLRNVRFVNRTLKIEPALPSPDKIGVQNGDMNDSGCEQSFCNGNSSCDQSVQKTMEYILEYEKVSDNLKTLLKSLFTSLKSRDHLEISENIEKLTDFQSMQFNKIRSIILENCRDNLSCSGKLNCSWRNSFIKNCKMLRKSGAFQRKSVTVSDNKLDLRTNGSSYCSNSNSIDENCLESDSVSQDSVNYKGTASSETSEDNCALEDRSGASKNLSSQYKEPLNGDLNYGAKLGGDEDDAEQGGEVEEEFNEGFNEGLICRHGNLKIDESTRRLVPVKVWEILKKYFPSSRTFPHDTIPCQQCQNLASEDEVVKDQFKKQAALEKEQLKDLYLGRNRPDLQNVEEVSTFFVLPEEEFVIPWRQFLRRAGREEPIRSLSTSALICKHGKLAYCLMRDKKRFVLVTEDEWNILTSVYLSECPITVTSIGDDTMDTNPEVCEECRGERLLAESKALLNYEDARIFVQKIQNFEDFLLMVPSAEAVTTVTASASVKEDTNEPKNKKVKVDSSGDSGPNGALLEGVRRSSRRRKVRDQRVFRVSSSFTLKQLKVMIMEMYGVLPFDQHLIYDGLELVEMDKTLAELQIYPDSVILLKVDEPTGIEEESCVNEIAETREVEAGFKGTKLIS